MKVHTTNYFDTFIIVADDCPAGVGEMPPLKGDKRTVANIQFELVKNNPYKYTSDEVLFQVYADRNDLTESEYEEAKEKFFSKGQACFRASPLGKRYGWGVHSNKEGKIAIYGCETEMYQKMLDDKALTVVKAMKTSR
ncbi:DUF6157 family protein [Solitalea canadensis]|uniref:Uncharacterized protein n=1 Tax=Solitalea canadensis (strain ATCC 29591 / DSM 3403 / JCM 21819 / LMG 8368 / NBRC 15130 / NCIMB 12057 / USAM 9D) TaxID=929556 RepID=H8KVG6_SOLCM|nr:DUF6157 family protein [Solitalea canadensis]AFD06346.1 hypothetical protein Solca_1252 [Solitalea canadensis DSM 3403]